MIVTCIYPMGERIKLSINKDNYLLPILSRLEISETAGANLYIDSLLTNSNNLDYNGEDKLIECGEEKCKINAIIDIAPENFKMEYHNFTNTLKTNYIGDVIDEELLFTAFKEKEEDFGINLCTFNRQIGSINEDERLNDVYKYVMYLPNIFYRPKMHLKANNEIRPIDTANRIGYEAIRHLASHSEHWEARTASGLIPARILAKILEDNYSIYENVAAKCLVDKLYRYAIKKLEIFKNISMQMPSEESFMSVSNEQKNFFRAREILLKGYSNYDDIKFINELLKDQILQLNYIISKLSECKDTLLYRDLKHCNKIIGPLKQTNIFMMDNNYKYVYKLWKPYSDKDTAQSNTKHIDITNGYQLYCQTLLVFALNNFNFSNVGGDNANVFENDKFVGGHYSFKEWDISLRCIEITEIETMGMIASVTMKMKHEIDVKGIVLPEVKDVSNIDFIYVSGEKLVFTKIPSDNEIDDFCNLIRKKAKGDRGKEKKLFRELKTKITDGFTGFTKKDKNILFIPLSFKFIDSSITMQKCIELMDEKIINITKNNNISTYYYLTPFRPTDYSEKETYAQLSSIFQYSYAVLDSPQCKNKPLKGILPITMNDINSYRRLTKVILMQMIEVDIEQKYCPICGHTFIERENFHYCRNCEMKVYKTECNNCKEIFKFTKYNIPKMNSVSGDTVNLKMLIKESREGFKNITDIDERSNKPICPFCGSVHEKVLID